MPNMKSKTLPIIKPLCPICGSTMTSEILDGDQIYYCDNKSCVFGEHPFEPEEVKWKDIFKPKISPPPRPKQPKQPPVDLTESQIAKKHHLSYTPKNNGLSKIWYEAYCMILRYASLMKKTNRKTKEKEELGHLHLALEKIYAKLPLHRCRHYYDLEHKRNRCTYYTKNPMQYCLSHDLFIQQLNPNNKYKLQSAKGAYLDLLSTAKNVLEDTWENRVIWTRDPSAIDIQGLDTKFSKTDKRVIMAFKRYVQSMIYRYFSPQWNRVELKRLLYKNQLREREIETYYKTLEKRKEIIELRKEQKRKGVPLSPLPKAPEHPDVRRRKYKRRMRRTNKYPKAPDLPPNPPLDYDSYRRILKRQFLWWAYNPDYWPEGGIPADLENDFDETLYRIWQPEKNLIYEEYWTRWLELFASGEFSHN